MANMETQKNNLHTSTSSVYRGYIVSFGNSYYSEKQPNYEWSFTQNINEAKIYKSKRNAEDLVRHAIECGKYFPRSKKFVSGYKIIEVNVEVFKAIKIILENQNESKRINRETERT